MSEENKDVNPENGTTPNETAPDAALVEAKALAEKWKNDYLYLRAEFENYKKSALKERSELLKYGSERIIAEVLEVVDNFDRALSMEVTADNFRTFKEGMTLTRSTLSQVLTRFGVSEIECQGVAFDPNVHEALSSEASADVPEGHILRVFKKAYKLHDRLVRPAQVVVAKPIEN